MISKLFVNREEYPLTTGHAKLLNEQFQAEQLVMLPRFFNQEAFALLVAEMLRMEDTKTRRDLLMPDTANTPRKMSTLGGLEVAQWSSIIPLLYNDRALLDFLSIVVGESIYPVPDPVENHVCNYLHRVGDIHGGHVDAYPYAFNTVVEAPDRDGGGWLEVAPGSTDVRDLDDPAKVLKYYIPRGDSYIFRTDTSAHRVSPLTKPGRRTIVNFAYANSETVGLEQSYSSSLLYGSQ